MTMLWGWSSWMLPGACLGREAGARNLVFFRVKWLRPVMEATSSVCDGCGCGRFEGDRFPLCVLQRVVVHACVILCICCLSACRSQWSSCMNVALDLCWGESWSTKPCFSMSSGFGRRWKVPPVLCAAGAAAAISSAIGSSSVFCNEWLFMRAWFFAFVDSLVADRIVLAVSKLLGATAACAILVSFCSWTSQIVLEWLHQGRDDALSANFLNFGSAMQCCFSF